MPQVDLGFIIWVFISLPSSETRGQSWSDEATSGALDVRARKADLSVAKPTGQGRIIINCLTVVFKHSLSLLVSTPLSEEEVAACEESASLLQR